MAHGNKQAGETFEVECPCCGGTLKIDTRLRAVIDHQAKAKPKTIEDFTEGLQQLRGAEKAREDAFQRSFESLKSSKDVLDRKFDELLKKAQASDPNAPPPKPIGLE
jgi:hypothetical protein